MKGYLQNYSWYGPQILKPSILHLKYALLMRSNAPETFLHFLRRLKRVKRPNGGVELIVLVPEDQYWAYNSKSLNLYLNEGFNQKIALHFLASPLPTGVSSSFLSDIKIGFDEYVYRMEKLRIRSAYLFWLHEHILFDKNFLMNIDSRLLPNVHCLQGQLSLPSADFEFDESQLKKARTKLPHLVDDHQLIAPFVLSVSSYIQHKGLPLSIKEFDAHLDQLSKCQSCFTIKIDPQWILSDKVYNLE